VTLTILLLGWRVWRNDGFSVTFVDYSPERFAETLIIRGTMVWPHISRYEIQYMDGYWFIEGREVTLSDVDKVVSRMEEHK